MRYIKHIIVIIAAVVAVFLFPVIKSGSFAAVFNPVQSDATTSASVVIDQPSGQFLVLINTAMHTDEENLAEWIAFFSGEEITYIFEDITVSVAQGDTSAVDLAESFQSQLPENQMEITAEDATLLLSRAENGKFDILILSAEFAETYGAATIDGDEVEWIEVEGGGA